jgi:hypothetical protein
MTESGNTWHTDCHIRQQYMNSQILQKASLKTHCLALVLAAGVVAPAQAIPSLQLDAAPSLYNHGDESVQATANPFQLYALANNDSSFSMSSTYYISLAIVNHSGAPMTLSDMFFGSFNVSGSGISGGSKTYSYSDLVFGNPPFEANVNMDAGDLPSHGIYPTYFAQVGFKFDAAKTATPYNSADTPGALSSHLSSGGSLYYQDWNIDISGLKAGYDLHIDLYDEALKKGDDVDVNDFAPFSHDAVSGPHGGVSVSDTSNSASLLGLALLGLLFLRFRGWSVCGS